eukprot:gnl/TRDRNA2_/TRDRNA2_178069_c0_seq3.p1 gnl/TRDRNA2_/TRDRNA2_178069_c0~~gnl/TRDRNA2_/TRDRNA2_178069_c0_seq3.p1  ORF type:complete len:402 (-),score=-28.19 gnl/TRDRNA2_/TRDRNA2_178069_c0_seq3:221-1426(-)
MARRRNPFVAGNRSIYLNHNKLKTIQLKSSISDKFSTIDESNLNINSVGYKLLNRSQTQLKRMESRFKIFFQNFKKLPSLPWRKSHTGISHFRRYHEKYGVSLRTACISEKPKCKIYTSDLPIFAMLKNPTYSQKKKIIGKFISSDEKTSCNHTKKNYKIFTVTQNFLTLNAYATKGLSTLDHAYPIIKSNRFQHLNFLITVQWKYFLKTLKNKKISSQSICNEIYEKIKLRSNKISIQGNKILYYKLYLHNLYGLFEDLYTRVKRFGVNTRNYIRSSWRNYPNSVLTLFKVRLTDTDSQETKQYFHLADILKKIQSITTFPIDIFHLSTSLGQHRIRKKENIDYVILYSQNFYLKKAHFHDRFKKIRRRVRFKNVEGNLIQFTDQNKVKFANKFMVEKKN